MSEDTALPAGARRGITRRFCKLARAALAALSVSLAVIGAATLAAHAQVTTPPQAGAQDSGGLGHPQIFITPYLWLPCVYATTETPLAICRAEPVPEPPRVLRAPSCPRGKDHL